MVSVSSSAVLLINFYQTRSSSSEASNPWLTFVLKKEDVPISSILYQLDICFCGIAVWYMISIFHNQIFLRFVVFIEKIKKILK